jgi:hypothetical protein
MARPVSWLPRLPALARAVGESARSHYACSDLERLFEVQPRSAQMLMNNLPTVRIGKSLLVEREALAGWLGRLATADDPARELASMRTESKPPIVRRKLRELVQRDVAAGESSLPANVHLETGSLAVTFTTVEELATALWRLAMLLEEDLDGFALLYEPAPETDDDQEETQMERADVAYIREWLAAQPQNGNPQP